MLQIKKVGNTTLKNLFKRSLTNNQINVRGADYQYLQRSRVPTFHFQKSLPRLPIPVLNKTAERYLNALQPLLNFDQFHEAKCHTENFISKQGKDLQEKLVTKDKRNKHTSYISDYWFDLYLKERAPLPINYNPILVFQSDPQPDYNGQLLRSTNLLISALRFYKSLREQTLEPEVFHLNPKKSDTELFRNVTRFLPEAVSWYGAYLFKAYPLDMSQFPGLFGATRIPLVNKDKIFRDTKSKHIVVQRKGHFYAIDVLDKDGYILSPVELLSSLNQVLSDDKPWAEHPVGVLTCQNRDEWARQRLHLEEIGNADTLRKIDSALFNLILDEDEIKNDKHLMLKHYLHADGLNRWFDKSFSLIVTKDGMAGVNFEHSWGDGVAVLRFFQDIYKDTTTNPFVHPDSRPTSAVSNVRELDFILDDKSKHSIQTAKKEYSEWCDSLSIDYILYEGLTKEACKKYQVSPDCIMQLVFQAAYHLLHNTYVGTYESCSTSAFKHGRTETMRPCTMNTKKFVDSLHLNKCSKQELRSIMAECSTNHSKLVKESAMGQGFDRHLFALMKTAEENNLPRPEFFDSYEYKFLNKSILSTSTLSAPSMQAGLFGPVVKEGYGIAYTGFPEMLAAAITSYKAHNDSTQFVEALYKSFLDITDILGLPPPANK